MMLINICHPHQGELVEGGEERVEGGHQVVRRQSLRQRREVHDVRVQDAHVRVSLEICRYE